MNSGKYIMNVLTILIPLMCFSVLLCGQEHPVLYLAATADVCGDPGPGPDFQENVLNLFECVSVLWGLVNKLYLNVSKLFFYLWFT